MVGSVVPDSYIVSFCNKRYFTLHVVCTKHSLISHERICVDYGSIPFPTIYAQVQLDDKMKIAANFYSLTAPDVYIHVWSLHLP